MWMACRSLTTAKFQTDTSGVGNAGVMVATNAAATGMLRKNRQTIRQGRMVRIWILSDQD